MKAIICSFIVFLLFIPEGYSQDQLSHDEDILKSILLAKSSEKDWFYLKCSKSKTFFSTQDFLAQTSLVGVAKKTLEEVEKNSKHQEENQHWSNRIFEWGKSINKKVSGKACFSNKEINPFFEKEQRRIKVYSVSKPIFDKSYEHCVVQVAIQSFLGSAYGNSILLKKIYGKWIVIESFDFWLT